MERVVGIEPTFPAWKAGVLPIYDTRIFFLIIINFVLLRQFRHCAPHLYYISSGAPSSFPCTTRS